MAVEAERLLAIFEARFTNLEKAFAKARTDGTKTFDALETAGTRAERTLSQIGRGGARGMDGLADSTRGASIQTGNLASQLNDIGVQLAGGQSPFLIAIQQGTQIQQALGNAGAGAAVRALGGAFTSLLNPVGLATIAIIGLAGTAAQYFTEWLTSGKATSEEMEKQADLIRRVADRLGDTVPELRRYAEELERVARARENIQGLEATKDKYISDLREEFEKFTKEEFEPISFNPEINDAYYELGEAIDAGTQNAAHFQKLIDAINKALQEGKSEELEKAAEAASNLGRISANVTEPALKRINDQLNAMNPSTESVIALAVRLTSSLLGLGQDGDRVVKQLTASFANNLSNGIQSAIDRIKELVKDFGNLQRQVEQVPLGTIPPVYSAGGKFTDEAGLQDYRARTTMSDFERNNPKSFLKSRAVSDRIAGRVDALDEAFSKQLSELLIQFPEIRISSARRTRAEQAAIYNSGVRPAAKPGNSLHEKGLAVDLWYGKGGLPPKDMLDRLYNSARQAGIEFPVRNDPMHAQPVGASARSGEYSSRSSAPKKTPSELFEGSLDDVRDRIAVLNAEIEAQGGLSAAIDQKQMALDKARIAQELLNEAENKGLKVTPAIKAGIMELAENYARLNQQKQANVESQRELNKNQEEFANDVKGGIKSFISDLRSGKSLMESLGNALERVADKLIDMAIDGMFAPSGAAAAGGGGLGLIGKLFGFLKLAGGGRVQGPGGPKGDKIPAMLSDGEHVTRSAMAKKHGRLLDAINADKVPKLAKGTKGTLNALTVPTLAGPPPDAAMPRRSGSRDVVRLELVDDSGRMSSIADQRIQTASGTLVEISTKRAVDTVSRNIGKINANASRRARQ